MGNFNHFNFLKELRQGFEPTEEDLADFNLFMTQMALSMDRKFINHCDAINTEKFFKLPKKIQCLAFTSFKGQYIDTSWKKAKAGTTKGKAETIEKVMYVFDLSYSEAESCLHFGTVDLDEVEDLYARLFDPESIKFRKSRVTRKKV